MMPTFPPPPLKFRTVGFPQYGFKASLSARACPAGPEVKRPPRIPSDRDEFTPGLRLPDRSLPTALRSGPDSGQSGWGVPARRAADPRGPQLRPGYAVPALLAYTTPCASLGSTRGLRGVTAYTPGLRWAGAPEATPETFPTFAAGLSARATDSTPVGPRPPPVVVSGRGTRLPRIRRGSPPTPSPLPAIPGECSFRRGILCFMLRPVRLPSPPGWLLRYRVPPALGAGRHRSALGGRLDGRTGNLPSSGLPPD